MVQTIFGRSDGKECTLIFCKVKCCDCERSVHSPLEVDEMRSIEKWCCCDIFVHSVLILMDEEEGKTE